MENFFKELSQNRIDALERLGLTSVQAKVYLATVLGCSSAKQISKTSNICSGDVYRALWSLQARGLMSKKIGKPTRFIPIKFRDGIKILTTIKKYEDEKMEVMLNQLKSLTDRFEGYGFNAPEKGLVWIPPKLVNYKADEIIKNAKKEVCGIFSTDNFRLVSKAQTKELKTLGIRYIIEKSGSTFVPFFQEGKKRVEIRYQDKPVSVNVFFNDIDQIFFTAVPNAIIGYFSNVYSDNPALAMLIRELFEMKWKLATSTTAPQENKI